MKVFREFCFFFFVQALSYGAITWNLRSTAQARFAHMVVSDMLCAFIGFKLIGKVAGASDSKPALAGYVLGGACGSVLSAWLTDLSRTSPPFTVG